MCLEAKPKHKKKQHCNKFDKDFKNSLHQKIKKNCFLHWLTFYFISLLHKAILYCLQYVKISHTINAKLLIFLKYLFIYPLN